MIDNSERINELLRSLDALLKKQDYFSYEINVLKKEVEQLKTAEEAPRTEKELEEKEPIEEKIETPHITAKVEPPTQPETKTPPVRSNIFKKKKVGLKQDLEKFIGENLINKIGIAVTVIGVSIGAKYAIDNELISPITRIILGYLVGFGLLGFAIKLKKNYDNFSAVLLSGSVAILYFITYAAFTYYGLFSQIVTFILMVIITLFTVLAAIHYNKQVIAHFGLVGAYAIPFLLNEDPGNVKILFSYVALINIGILFVAIKKFWKILFYAAFILTWGIYLMWFGETFDSGISIGISLVFVTIFFIIFYLIFLAYKLIEKEKFEFDDVLILLVNSFIFYGVGYKVLDSFEAGQNLLGLFTLGNALIHFVISFIIYKQKLADRNLFYLISGLVLLFITITIPVQLNGNWVTLLWVGEAALLFWVGRSKREDMYEYLSYLVMWLAFFSLLHDWGYIFNQIENSNAVTEMNPLLNMRFLSSVLFIGAFAFINWFNQKVEPNENILRNKAVYQFMSVVIPAVFLVSLYNTFRIEIVNYWDLLYAESGTPVDGVSHEGTGNVLNVNFLKFKTLWVLNYTIIFLSILSIFNFKKLKNKNLGLINLFLNLVTVFFFLSIALFELSELRESYLMKDISMFSNVGTNYLLIRYISIIFIGILLASTWKFVLRDFIKTDFKIPFEIIIIVAICWIASSELLQWLAIGESKESYKLALSIFWGVYSLILIAFGIWKNKKHVRILAILLFAVTLIKLFFYDITHLDTISKTIVFVALGVLLLIISFLYNKYKQKIFP
jgi:uncharacterized membrane protein